MTRHAFRRLCIALGVVTVAGMNACESSLGDAPDYEPVDAPPRNRDVDATSSPDAPGAANPVPIDAGKGNGCPSGRGPEMIRAGATCIDATEVTYAQYQQFVDERAGDAGGQPPECAWNKDFFPYSGWPFAIGKEQHPAFDVTWCSAYAYCQWAGKRLCGTTGSGAPVAPNDVADAAADEWFAACSRGGERAHPYGNTYEAGACNGADVDAGATRPVGTMPKCTGGYAGITDITGNAEEWESSCEATTAGDAGRQDVCLARGGRFDSPRAGLACAARVRLYRGNHAGIRCCATPSF